MTMNNLAYNVKEGCRNIVYNKLMSFASVGVLTACLILIGSAMLVSMNITGILDKVKEQNEVIIFLKDDITEEERNKFEAELKTKGDVIYVSKDQAIEEFIQGIEGGESLMERFKKDKVLPAKFKVTLRELEEIRGFMAEMEQRNYVEKVNAPTEAAENLLELDKWVKIAATIAVIVLIFISLVIVQNTIRISVFSRRREINIMKYVGATNGFIGLPFMVEGALLGLISALLGFLIIYLGYNQILSAAFSGDNISWLADTFGPNITFQQIGWQLLIVFLLFGIATGILGSVLSTRKHLKV